MKGFYTKQEVSKLLGITIRSVTSYLEKGILSKTYRGSRVYIPRNDVLRLYDNPALAAGDGPAGEIDELKRRVNLLTHEMEVVKMGLGFGAPTPPRTDADLLVMRQQHIDLLSKMSWSSKEISGVADALISIQESDLLRLYDQVGERCWHPLFQASQRMLAYLEGLAYFPERGSGMLHGRLLKARDRFLGLVYTMSRLSTGTTKKSKAILEQLVLTSAIDRIVLDYVIANV